MGPQNRMCWMLQPLPLIVQPFVILYRVPRPLPQVLLHPQNRRHLRILLPLKKQSKQTLSNQWVPALWLERVLVFAHGWVEQRPHILHVDKWIVEVREHADNFPEEVHWERDWECALRDMQAVELMYLQVRMLWQSRASLVCVHQWVEPDTISQWWYSRRNRKTPMLQRNRKRKEWKKEKIRPQLQEMRLQSMLMTNQLYGHIYFLMSFIHFNWFTFFIHFIY